MLVCKQSMGTTMLEQFEKIGHFLNCNPPLYLSKTLFLGLMIIRGPLSPNMSHGVRVSHSHLLYGKVLILYSNSANNLLKVIKVVHTPAHQHNLYAVIHEVTDVTTC